MSDLDFVIGHWLSKPYLWTPHTEWNKCVRQYIYDSMDPKEPDALVASGSSCTVMRSLFQVISESSITDQMFREGRVRIFGVPISEISNLFPLHDSWETITEDNASRLIVNNPGDVQLIFTSNDTDSPLKVPKINDWYFTNVMLQQIELLQTQNPNVLFPFYEIHKSWMESMGSLVGVHQVKPSNYYAINVNGNGVIENVNGVIESFKQCLIPRQGVEYLVTYINMRDVEDGQLVETMVLLLDVRESQRKFLLFGHFNGSKYAEDIYAKVKESIIQKIIKVTCVGPKDTLESIVDRSVEVGLYYNGHLRRNDKRVYEYDLPQTPNTSEREWLAGAYVIYLTQVLLSNFKHNIVWALIANLGNLVSKFNSVSKVLKHFFSYTLAYPRQYLDNLSDSEKVSLSLALYGTKDASALPEMIVIPKDDMSKVSENILKHLAAKEVNSYVQANFVLAADERIVGLKQIGKYAIYAASGVVVVAAMYYGFSQLYMSGAMGLGLTDKLASTVNNTINSEDNKKLLPAYKNGHTKLAQALSQQKRNAADIEYARLKHQAVASAQIDMLREGKNTMKFDDNNDEFQARIYEKMGMSYVPKEGTSESILVMPKNKK